MAQLAWRVRASTWLGALVVQVPMLGFMTTWGHERGTIDVAQEEETVLGHADAIRVVVLDADTPGPLRVDPPVSEVPTLGQGSEHPRPKAATDAPGLRGASRGRGGGARDSLALRNDADSRSATVWNDPSQHRISRRRSSSRRRSPEALVRVEESGFADRQTRAARARRGGTARTQAPTVEVELVKHLAPEQDPVVQPSGFSGHPVVGRTEPTQRVLADRGSNATEAHSRGRAADDVDSTSRSADKTPSPFERSHPSVMGGGAPGASASSGDSIAATGSTGRDTAMTTRPLRNGPDGAFVQADRDRPYFRSMYAAVDKQACFPRERALMLDQGEVVLHIRLDAEGRIRDLEVHSGSGFGDFDREAQRAFRAAAPFGAVPPALLTGGQVRIAVPYYFKNPMIR